MNPPAVKNVELIHIFDTLVYPPQHPEIQLLSNLIEEPSIHGDKVWEASFILMDFLEKFPLESANGILEIGCGWGILTSYLAKHYHELVTGLDADSAVKPYFDFHLNKNKVTAQFKCGTMQSLTKQQLSNYEVIMGGDICFWDNLKQDWQNLIRRALKAGVKEIYIADPGRPPFWELVDYAEKKFNADIWSHDISEPHSIEHYVLEIKA